MRGDGSFDGPFARTRVGDHFGPDAPRRSEAGGSPNMPAEAGTGKPDPPLRPPAATHVQELSMSTRTPLALLITLALAACGDRARPIVAPEAAPDLASGAAGRATAAAERATTRTTAAARWNALTRTIVGRREPGPLGTARTFALVSVAQYDAAVAAKRGKAGRVHPSEAGAAAAASAAVLRALYPAEQALVDAQLAADRTDLPSLPTERDADFAAGEAVGREVGAAALARAATDGSNAVWTGAVPVGPGFWRNAPPARPLGPRWGEVRPWFMTAGDQFRPAAPPAFGSAEFLDALAEVRRVTDALTPAQLQVAQFWQYASGPGGPIGYFGAVARGLAAREHLDERHTARVLAVVHAAMMDASIGCWDAKYAYWYVRPHQADPLIATPVGRPNFPSYPSAHSCLSAAAVGVLAGLFPRAADDLHAQVAEAGVARLYAGLHFRFDVDAGQQLGFAVGRLALERAPRGLAAIPLE
jgi:membrane-associated phospholipid phosphatase